MKTPLEVTKFVTEVIHTYNKSKNLEYLKRKEKNPLNYSASSAGSCLKKQYISITPPSLLTVNETEPKSQRIMRLGTVVHADIEEALILYKGILELSSSQDPKLHMEQEIYIPSLNVRGTYDCFLEFPDYGVLIDFKTCGSFPWRKKFGRDKPNPYDRRYSLQIATYAIGLYEQFKFDNIYMFLVYYNKDTSIMKSVQVHDEELDKAEAYWRQVIKSSPEFSGKEFHNVRKGNPERFKEYMDKEYLAGIDVGVPFENWECKYCQYNNSKTCEGV